MFFDLMQKECLEFGVILNNISEYSNLYPRLSEYITKVHNFVLSYPYRKIILILS